MDRRTFIDMLVGSLLVAPLPAPAQQTGKVYRLGILTAGTITSDWTLFVELRERGWIEGQNLVIERRAAGGKAELVPGFADELVQLRLDVIVATGAVASLAAKNATTTIPLVTITGDPVRIGLVPSMSRPGGNITGTSTVSPELAAKRLELLRELRPTAKRIGGLVDPANQYFRLIRKDNEQIYRMLGMEPIFVDVADATQLERAIAEVARLRADALIVRSDPLFSSNRDQIASLALKHALPTMAEGNMFVSAGCLASYAASFSALGRGLAVFVDKILRGAKPGDLPIEQPTKYDLVINLRTAKALGIAVPQSLLVRADEVIQ
jgi:putative tryptophan/tyrosine transport system substrate-binding protein